MGAEHDEKTTGSQVADNQQAAGAAQAAGADETGAKDVLGVGGNGTGTRGGNGETRPESGADVGGQTDANGASRNGRTANGAADFEKQIAKRDLKIAALEAQIAEAAKSAEAAEKLTTQIEELKAQSAAERVDFQLQLAGCRNVKAACAVLDDYEGDIDALREGEPWLFAETAKPKATGATGLPNAGAAIDEGATLKRWRTIAGLDSEDKG